MTTNLVLVLLALLVLLVTILGIRLYKLNRFTQAVIDQQSHWQALINNIPDLFIRTNDQLNIEFINPTSRNLLNHPPAQYKNKSLRHFFDSEQLPELNEIKTEDFFNHDQALIMEVQKLMGENEIIHLEFRFIPEFQSNDSSLHLIVIGRDITSQKKAEIKLHKAKRKAEESDQLKSAFLANMSHEIRTPLNAIVGFANLILEEELTDEEKQKYFKYINLNSIQLINLISDIIDLSKIESKQLQLSTSHFNLNQLLGEIEEVINSEKVNREKSHLLVIMETDLPDEDSILFTDPYRLRQILLNLLINAIKFTPKGYIQFGYKLGENNNLLFYVRDSGIGIPPEHQSVVFQHFRQLESKMSKSPGGTGLGLSICQHLVSLLQGRIWLQSEPGKGSTFYFTLPYPERKQLV